MESQAMQKIMKAKAALIIDQRFFGALACRLGTIEDPTTETMWVDGINIGFNPEWVLEISMDELKGVICHEILHIANGHHLRRNGRDFEDWNVGCDFAIDPTVISAGMNLPGGGHISADFADMSAEQIYSAIQGKKLQDESRSDSEKDDKNDNQSDSEDDTSDGNENEGGSEGPDSDGDSEDGQGDGDGQDGKADGDGQDGQDGKPGQGKGGKPSPTGEVRDYPTPNLTAADKDQLQQEWQIAVAQAANIAEGCGQMDGNLREMVSSMLDPLVPWQEILQRFAEQAANNDYSFMRPNVRYGSSEFIMPSLFNRQLGPIDIWIDTSGSISSEDKKQFVAEINDIRAHFQTDIRIIHCDTKVNHVDVIEPMDDFESLETFGGGGTKFSPAIEWSQDNEDQPICGIYLTDMDCEDYGTEPDFPVLWIDTRNASWTKTPPFGEIVKMHPKRF